MEEAGSFRVQETTESGDDDVVDVVAGEYSEALAEAFRMFNQADRDPMSDRLAPAVQLLLFHEAGDVRQWASRRIASDVMTLKELRWVLNVVTATCFSPRPSTSSNADSAMQLSTSTVPVWHGVQTILCLHGLDDALQDPEVVMSAHRLTSELLKTLSTSSVSDLSAALDAFTIMLQRFGHRLWRGSDVAEPVRSLRKSTALLRLLESVRGGQCSDLEWMPGDGATSAVLHWCSPYVYSVVPFESSWCSQIIADVLELLLDHAGMYGRPIVVEVSRLARIAGAHDALAKLSHRLCPYALGSATVESHTEPDYESVLYFLARDLCSRGLADSSNGVEPLSCASLWVSIGILFNQGIFLPPICSVIFAHYPLSDMAESVSAVIPESIKPFVVAVGTALDAFYTGVKLRNGSPIALRISVMQCDILVSGFLAMLSNSTVPSVHHQAWRLFHEHELRAFGGIGDTIAENLGPAVMNLPPESRATFVRSGTQCLVDYVHQPLGDSDAPVSASRCARSAQFHTLLCILAISNYLDAFQSASEDLSLPRQRLHECGDLVYATVVTATRTLADLRAVEFSDMDNRAHEGVSSTDCLNRILSAAQLTTWMPVDNFGCFFATSHGASYPSIATDGWAEFVTAFCEDNCSLVRKHDVSGPEFWCLSVDRGKSESAVYTKLEALQPLDPKPTETSCMTSTDRVNPVPEIMSEPLRDSSPQDAENTGNFDRTLDKSGDRGHDNDATLTGLVADFGGTNPLHGEGRIDSGDDTPTPFASVSTATYDFERDPDNLYVLPDFSSSEDDSAHTEPGQSMDVDETIEILDSSSDDEVPIVTDTDENTVNAGRISFGQSVDGNSTDDDIPIEVEMDSGSSHDEHNVKEGTIDPKGGKVSSQEKSSQDLTRSTVLNAGFRVDRHRPAPKVPTSRRQQVLRRPIPAKSSTNPDADDSFGFSIIEDAPKRVGAVDVAHMRSQIRSRSPIPGAGHAKSLHPGRSSPATQTQFARQRFLTRVLAFKVDDLRTHLSASANVPSLPQTFESISQYQEVYCDLLVEECRAQLEADWVNVNAAQTKECRVDRISRVKGVLQLDVSLSGRSDTLVSDTIVTVKTAKGPLASTMAIIKENSYRNSGTRLLLKALVEPVVGGVAPFSERVKVGQPVLILVVSNIRSIVRQVEAIGAIGNNSLHHQLLGQKSKDDKEGPERMSLLPQGQTWKTVRDRLQHELNESQLDAVAACLSDSNKLVAVQGPPGTGKTTTLVALVGSILRGLDPAVSDDTPFRTMSSGCKPRSRLKEVSLAGMKGGLKSGRRLLVCAPSNAATDELVRRFGRVGSDTDLGHLRLVRVGYHSHTSVAHWSLDRLVQLRLEELTSKFRDKQRQLSQLRTELSDAKVKLSKVGGQITEAENFINVPGCGEDIRGQIAHLKYARESATREVTQHEINIKRLAQDVTSMQRRLSKGEQECRQKVCLSDSCAS